MKFALFQEDKLLQVRTGKAKDNQFDLGEASAIFKTSLSKPVFVSTLGCVGDERSYPPHTVAENALHHYDSQHYAEWSAEYPSNPHFRYGAFGENLVSSNASENTICIGDIIKIGNRGLIVEVTKPRQPCYKLNHRFQIKDMSLKSQISGRTGWYYRVLEDGWMETGDSMILVQRKWPKWTISEVQRLLYRDRNEDDDMRELSRVPELGDEIKSILEARLAKRKLRDDNDRLQGGNDNLLKWFPYRLVNRKKETPRICSMVFEAINIVQSPIDILPGSHIRVKLGDDGKLVRAYSVVSGNSNRFKLAIALEPDSRGGSRHMHEKIEVGDSLSFSDIKSDFPLIENADQHIIIAGGIGITAFVAAAKDLQRKGDDFQLHYAVRSRDDIALLEDLESLRENLFLAITSEGHRLDIRSILRQAKGNSHVYICGPDRLLSAVVTMAKILGYSSDHIHSEAFIATTSGDPFSAELVRAKKVIEVKEEQTLLDVLRDAGFDVPSTCEVGNCGTCKVGVRSGRVEHRGTGLSAEEKSESMLCCVSRGIGRIALDL